MSIDVSIHDATTIRAHSPATLGAPLVLSATGADLYTRIGSVTFYLGDQALVDRLVEAINNQVIETKCETDPAHKAAHDAVTAYDYRGSNR